jgi:hypothetical protein
MNAAARFVAGRGAIPIREAAEFFSRGNTYIYQLIGRGDLRQLTAGHVTADSLVEFYSKFEESPAQPQTRLWCGACGHKTHGQIGCRDMACSCTRVTPIWRTYG